MSFNLRKRIPISYSYYEPEEPGFDQYIFCDQCSDYVFEYCAIHGPLLVIPDDKVPPNLNFPSYVPRAAFTLPHVFLHLAPSVIPGAGLGVFSTLTLPRGVRFGPYRGQRTQNVDSMYCWQIFSSNNKRSHVVDAADAYRSNWMRYVNCSRHWREQNLVAYQYKGQLYYRTIKTIPRFTELMVFYGSEFANVLNINLKLYNSPSVYVLRYGTQKSNLSSLDKPKYYHEGKILTERKESSDEKESKEVNEASHNNIAPSSVNVIYVLSEQNETVNIENKIKEVPDYKVLKKNDNVFENNTDPKDRFSFANEYNIQKPLSCDLCTYSCKKKSDLVRHNRRHTGEKPYKCDCCQYSSAVKSDLTQHIRRHTGEKPYKCDFCQYSCAEKSHLTQHIRIHTGEKPYKCKICHRNFRLKKSLPAHLRTHTGEKPYKCDICQRAFNQRYDLTRHNRTHTGEKPYSCHICHQKFIAKSYLNRHMHIHSSEKPYKCDICQYRFVEKNSLNRHIKTHTGENLYKCDICQDSFSRKIVLTKHILLHMRNKK